MMAQKSRNSNLKTNNLKNKNLNDKYESSWAFKYLQQKTLIQRDRYYQSVMKFELESRKDTDEFEYITTIQFGKLKEAEDYYNDKLLNVCAKLDKSGFLEDGISLSGSDLEVSNKGVELWFEASKRSEDSYSQIEMGRVYARFVWVECYEKASHWRFVITLKKSNKIHKVF